VSTDGVLSEQLSYYRARAEEYDRWWLRLGRFDRGAEANARWREEIARLEAALEQVEPRGEILELACGTGIWTQALVGEGRRVTAVDAAPEVLAINRGRLADHPVEYVQADLFTWEPPPAAYDLCVFAFWLSHVPEERFAGFWQRVGRALRPGGRAFFIDSARTERSTAADHTLPAGEATTMTRRLDDGREFQIVKRFYAPEQLEADLARLGWAAQVRRTGEFFIHGTAHPISGESNPGEPGTGEPTGPGETRS
jgi:SAM-dependent methyltransferase